MEIKKFNLFKDFTKLKKLLLKEERWSFGSYESKLKKRRCMNLYIIRSLCCSDNVYVYKNDNDLLGIIGIDYHKRKTFKKIIANMALKIFCLFITKKEKNGIYEYYFGTENVYKGSPCCESVITLLMVDKEKRGLGVGKELIEYAENKLRKISVANIGVNTDSCCDYKFYEKMKYVRVFEGDFNEDEIFFYKKDF